MNFQYSNASFLTDYVREGGLLVSMKDHFGREWKFGYEDRGEDLRSRINAIVDPGNGITALEYGAGDGVSKVTWSDSTSRQFLYENTNLSWALTGYLDENGVRAGRYAYDSDGRAISTERALGLDRYSVAWTAPSRWQVNENWDSYTGWMLRDHVLTPPTGIVVTNPNGQTEAVTAAGSLGQVKWTSKAQAAGAGSAAATTSRVLDANRNVVQLDEYNGNRSCMAYDMDRNLETSRVEGLSAATACEAAQVALPTGARRVSTQWHPDWRLAVKTAEPRRITTLVFNGQPDPFSGGAVASCAPTSALLPDGKPLVVLCKRVEQATTDETGAQGFIAALQSGVPARTASWTYNATGQVLTETDALNQIVVTNEYYVDTTVDHTLGDLKTSTNGAGHVTRFTRYDAYGKPLEVMAPNGATTTYAYDQRQRVTSMTTNGKATFYEYLPTGLLKRSVQPGGGAVNYEYDDAQRLLAVFDSLGNRISYTLDASGNRTSEVAKDPLGALKRTMSRTFDALNRAQQTTGRE